MQLFLFIAFIIASTAGDSGSASSWVCHPRCKDNEFIPGCIPCRPWNCDDRNDTVCNKKCIENTDFTCFCVDGYLRNSEGVCIKKDECGCGLNEHIPKCIPNPPYTCDESSDDSVCEEDECIPNTECYCKPGYLRNNDGVCIKSEECKCKENEYIPACVPCPPLNCGDKNDTVCALICKLNNDCYCKSGYLRNSEGVCVKAAECACKLNEYIPECVPCPPLNCGDRNDTVCTAQCTENDQCYCKRGYLRNSTGVCVEKDKCESCKGENERWYPCGYCGSDACGAPTKVCPAICKPNSGGCFCDTGYRRKNGVCVPEKKCSRY